MSLAIKKSGLIKICDLMNKLYPLKNADNSWDNTGLLIDMSKNDNLIDNNNNNINILLTIDLTESVAEEAIKKKCNLIISYHPFLFRKFNRILPTENSQQRSLVKLIENNISVYSPHTAVDAAIGGVNDWLVKCITLNDNIKESKVIIPDKENKLIGMGRIVEFNNNGIKIEEAINRIKKGLNIDSVQLCLSNKFRNNKDLLIKRIALCAGSGSSVFNKINQLTDPIDLYITGELSHHEILSIVNDNQSNIILCGHCNSERGYLGEMRDKLSHLAASIDGGENESKIEIEIEISETDKSPFVTV